MASASPRSAEQRKIDTLAKLNARHTDVWVATASESAAGSYPYLVPLSLSWIGDRMVVAMEPTSRTAHNVAAAGQARLALGPTRDLAIIDAK